MAAPTLADFRARFEDSQANDAAVSGALEDAKRLHAVTFTGWLECAAHLLVLDDGVSALDQGLGEVKSETIGPRIVQYSTMAGDGDDSGRRAFFSTTRHGRRVLAIEARTPRLVISAGVVA